MRALADKHCAYLRAWPASRASNELASGESRAGIGHAPLSVNSRLLVPMAGLIDPKAEIERLTKRIAKNESDIGKLRGKLGNENFVRNAPPERGRGRSRARGRARSTERQPRRAARARFARIG